LSLASKWLLRDAIDASGSRETIGADLLVPLFTMMLINAQLPNVHMILQVRKHVMYVVSQEPVISNQLHMQSRNP
jgi:hypothetical protein